MPKPSTPPPAGRAARYAFHDRRPISDRPWLVWDGKLYALDATTGDLKWSYNNGGMVRSSPAVSGGVLYVGADGDWGSQVNKVFALQGTEQPTAVTLSTFGVTSDDAGWPVGVALAGLGVAAGAAASWRRRKHN